MDLVGNIVPPTNVDRINEQLPSSAAIDCFDHDSIKLPNGHTLAIATNLSKSSRRAHRATPHPIPIIGRVLLHLDQNLQVAWY